jgi:hypothetical protein
VWTGNWLDSCTILTQYTLTATESTFDCNMLFNYVDGWYCDCPGVNFLRSRTWTVLCDC